MFADSLQLRDALDDSNNYVGLELLCSLVPCLDLRVLLPMFANKSTRLTSSKLP